MMIMLISFAALQCFSRLGIEEDVVNTTYDLLRISYYYDKNSRITYYLAFKMTLRLVALSARLCRRKLVLLVRTKRLTLTEPPPDIVEVLRSTTLRQVLIRKIATLKWMATMLRIIEKKSKLALENLSTFDRHILFVLQ